MILSRSFSACVFLCIISALTVIPKATSQSRGTNAPASNVFPKVSPSGKVVACATVGQGFLAGEVTQKGFVSLNEKLKKLNRKLKHGGSPKEIAAARKLRLRVRVENRICRKGVDPSLGTLRGQAICQSADFDGDQLVSFSDLKKIVAARKRKKNAASRFDLVQDGAINGKDVEIVLECWGPVGLDTPADSSSEESSSQGSQSSAWSDASSSFSSAVFDCGNAVCNAEEDCASCAQDCGQCGTAELLYQDDFEDGNYDAVDPNLPLGLSWEAVAGSADVRTALNGKAVALRRQNTTILAAPSIAAGEATIETKVNVVWSHPARIIFLYKDANNYYSFGIAGSRRGLYRVMDGVATKLSDSVYDHIMSLPHAGSSPGRFKVYYRAYDSLLKFKIDSGGFENGIDYEIVTEDLDPAAVARFGAGGRFGVQEEEPDPSNYVALYADDVKAFRGHKIDERVKPIETYYLDAALGNDSNPGTAQQPWRTFQKAADTMMAGDTVLAAPGIYKESGILPKFSGSRLFPISYKAADPNSPPVLEGSIKGDAFNWQVYSGGIYQTTIDWKPEMLLIAGVPMFVAQDPDQEDPDDQMQTRYFREVPAAQNDDSLPEAHYQLTDSGVLTQGSDDFWKGARLLVHDSYINAIDSERDVLEYDASEHRIMLGYNQWVAIGEDDKYALRNHLSVLDKPGEWVVEKGLLRVDTWTENPDKTLDATVTMTHGAGRVSKVRFFLINANSGSQTVVDSDVVVSGSQNFHIDITNLAQNLTRVYAAVEVADAYKLYVWPYTGSQPADIEIIKGASAFDISRGHKEWLVFDGLEMRYYAETPLSFSISYGSARHGLVRNCNIHHNQGSGVYARTNAEGLKVEYSHLHRNYGNGVSFGGGRDYYVEHNEIDRNLDNGIWSGNGGAELYYVRDVYIHGNIIHHQGSNRTHPDNIQLYRTHNAVVDGNYLLQEGHQNTWFSENGTIYFTNNIVIDGPAGINSAPNCYVYNNLFYNSVVRFDAWQEDEKYWTKHAEIRNNAFINSNMARPPERLWQNLIIDHNFYSASGSGWLNIGYGEGSIVNPTPGEAASLANYFADVPNDYRLSAASPLRDAGFMDVPAAGDFSDQRRFQGARPDIGPYETANPYSFADCFNGRQDIGEDGVDCGGICQQDFDSDGYPIMTCDPTSPILDCNDSDSTVNPGSAELPNGKDNNCDGQLHPECSLDTDGDGSNNCVDNCMLVSNSGQEDWDGDGLGNVCDPEASYVEDFQDRTTGAGDLTGLKRQNGLSWQTVRGQAAVQLSDGSKVLRIPNYQTGTHLVIANEGLNLWESYRLSLDVQKSWTSPTRGIVLSYFDADNFYYFDLQRGGRGAVVRRVNGVDTELGGSSFITLGHHENEMHHFDIEVRFVQGELLFQIDKDHALKKVVINDYAPLWTRGTIGFIFENVTSQFSSLIADEIILSVPFSPPIL